MLRHFNHRILLKTKDSFLRHYANIIKNSFAIIYPSTPHPGKVKTHVSTRSLTILQFTFLILRAAPTPIIAVVFVCVVLTGIPVRDDKSRQSVADKSAAKP